MAKMRKPHFIYLDLNATDGTRVLLDTRIEKEIIDYYGELKEGKIIHCCTDDGTAEKGFDPMVYFGVIGFDKADRRWFVSFDPNAIEHLSTSKNFKQFSLREVIGEEWYKSLQKTNPDWLW